MIPFAPRTADFSASQFFVVIKTSPRLKQFKLRTTDLEQQIGMFPTIPTSGNLEQSGELIT